MIDKTYLKEEGAMMSDVKALNEKDLQKVSGGSGEQGPVIVDGIIVSYCGNLVFCVELICGHRVSCEMDKKLKSKAVKLIVGDKVKVKLDQYNSCFGIIVEM